MTKLKMGIIGVGGIARSRHIPAYLNIKEKVELIAVQDVNHEKAKQIANELEIPNVFNNYYELFKVVDAVTICTPNKFHAEISIAALEAGVHVLCEKPMAITTEECERMINTSRKSNKKLSIAFHFRYTEAAKLSKSVVLSNEIGNPIVARIQALRRRKVPGWGVFINKELQGGGSLIDYGCHYLDLAMWLMDDPDPVEVLGTTYNHLSRTSSDLNEWGGFDTEKFEVDDHVSAYIKFSSGSSILFECSWAANVKEDTTHLSISGSNGGLNVFPFELYQPKYGTFMTSQAKADFNVIEAGNAQAENFVNSCLGIENLIVQPEQAMRVTKIIEAIYQSSEAGEAIKIN